MRMDLKEFLKPNKSKLIILMELIVLGFFVEWYDRYMPTHFSANNLPYVFFRSLTWGTERIFLSYMSGDTTDYLVCTIPECETISFTFGVIEGIAIYYLISCCITFIYEKFKSRK